MISDNLDDIEKEIDKEITIALKNHDELSLRKEVIKLIEYFLDGKTDVYDVEHITSNYLTAEYFYDECKDFEIQDEVLRSVYEGLAGISQYDLPTAKKIVRKFYDSLKQKK